jgi:hypothetical protein
MERFATTLEKNMPKRKTLFDYMSPAQKSAMYINGKQLPTWHSICTEKTGVARPGKTARDRANKIRRYINE